jgi:hypothetical protein
MLLHMCANNTEANSILRLHGSIVAHQCVLASSVSLLTHWLVTVYSLTQRFAMCCTCVFGLYRAASH